MRAGTVSHQPWGARIPVQTAAAVMKAVQNRAARSNWLRRSFTVLATWPGSTW